MSEIKLEYIGDPEACHSKMDDLMEAVLIEKGYGEGVGVARSTERWYA